MDNCIFCKIVAQVIDVSRVWEDDEILVFLDPCAVREAHCQIIPKQHYETFEKMPPELASKIIQVGQKIATKLKDLYGVERVAFLFTGGDVPHAHAHVIPMHEKTDITSARYIVNAQEIQFGSEHLMKTKEELDTVKLKIQGF